MKSGVSVFETYSGPTLDAVEFCLHPGNLETRSVIASQLKTQFNCVSAHLPSFLFIGDVEKETQIDVDYFVAHVTKKSTHDEHWKDAWQAYAKSGKKIIYENHNQDRHPTDAGLCWPDEFKPIADAGHKLCLDTGHILYSSSCKVDSATQWAELAEQVFDGFLEFPIHAVHAHTVSAFQGPDHQLSGFDIGPWLRRIIDKNPDVILLVETSEFSVEAKIAALHGWLGQ